METKNSTKRSMCSTNNHCLVGYKCFYLCEWKFRTELKIGYAILEVKKHPVSEKLVHNPNKEKVTVQIYRMNIYPSYQSSHEQYNGEKISWCESYRKVFPKCLQNFNISLTSYTWHLLNPHHNEHQLMFTKSTKFNYLKANNDPTIQADDKYI